MEENYEHLMLTLARVMYASRGISDRYSDTKGRNFRSNRLMNTSFDFLYHVTSELCSLLHKVIYMLCRKNAFLILIK